MNTSHHKCAKIAILILLLSLILSSQFATSSSPEQPSFTKNTLRWQTATEDQIFGYFIYRGESESGPFQLLNAIPLRGGGTTDAVQEYEFADEKAIPGKTYYYYLETLHYNNRRKKFSPIFPFHTPGA